MIILLTWPVVDFLLAIQRRPDEFFATTRFETIVEIYFWACLIIGGLLFPMVSIIRIARYFSSKNYDEQTETLDLWRELGPAVAGKGKWWWLARLPFTCAFKVDFTEVTLKLPQLPKAWDGLSILHLTDFHLHGTPTRLFFERVIQEIKTRWPVPDLIALTGDFLDSDAHAEWIEPLLSSLPACASRFAILGNHDEHFHPGKIRDALQNAGYTVIGNRWVETTVRGEKCAIVGHEGPWFGPPPGACPTPELPKICLSHSPDNIYWAAKEGCAIAFSGHVHGGQIRIPIVGPIFIPSIYSRRFDSGLFDVNGTALVVGRGLSGKEPIRFRCHPQVIRVVIRTV